ncbi:MAG: hypothetical protein SVR81_06395, partial [Chloroflexota bacterium]|nr:hypothetical protein [Chloroflexota bacterium]
MPLDELNAVVYYHVNAQRRGQPVYSAWLTSVSPLQEGDWKLALHQQTVSSEEKRVGRLVNSAKIICKFSIA